MKDEPFIPSPSSFILELIDPVTTEPKGEAWTSIGNLQLSIVNVLIQAIRRLLS